MDETHTCPAYGCEVQVKNSALFCSPHWALVPSRLKDAILDSFQRRYGDDGVVTSTWGDAIADSIDAIKAKEPDKGWWQQ